MIGLENGGGKSTLLGFLIHVFLPGATQFLPRLAQRRQKKEGEEKRIEHYVPGGPPTHVVVELELPDSRGSARAPSGRVLVGACLYKDAGAGAAVRAEEFLWSARCVTEELTLASLRLRGDGGRMLDHREWRAWLERMKAAHPGEVQVYDTHKGWDSHLRYELRVDVEFVRSWLLQMNEDEGAADHVFTYASSRAFLNSLVGAVADPDLVADLKKSLTAMGTDADQMLVDRRREVLLQQLVHDMGPMADLTGELGVLDGRRRELVRAFSTARIRVAATITPAEEELRSARAQEDLSAVAARDAAVAYYEALAHETLSRLQLAELRLADVEAQIKVQSQTQREADDREQRTLAAALLAERRTVHGQIRETEQALAAKAHDAEPVRRAAASAAQAWRARIDAEIDSLQQLMLAQARRSTAAKEAVREADRVARAAGQEAGRLQEVCRALTEQIAAVDRQKDEAVRSGELPIGETAAEAAKAATHAAEDLRERSRQAEQRRGDRQRDLDTLAIERSELEGRAVRTDENLRAAEARLIAVRQAADGLTEALAASHLLDLDPIRLEDHVHLMVGLLGEVAASAQARQLDAAVQAATARRAVHALEGSGLLPARPDIVAFCELAARLGARPGWSYLAELPADVAEEYAACHPELADGVVVNIPEDVSAVVELARRERRRLDGPIVIGSPRVFAADGPDSDVTVVLPDEGFWSRAAADRQMGNRQAEYERVVGVIDAEARRYECAVQLGERVRGWLEEFGPRAAVDAEATLRETKALIVAIVEERLTMQERSNHLTEERDRAASETREFATEAATSQARADRLSALAACVAEREVLEGRIRTHQAELDQAKGAGDAAEAAAAKAEAEREAAEAGGREHEVAIAALRPLRSDAAAMEAVVARSGDPIEDLDATADRLLLASLARSRYERWQGLSSDPQLRAELEQHRRVLHSLEERIGKHPPEVIAGAGDLLAADPTRTSVDFEQMAAEAQHESKSIAGILGRLEQQRINRGEAVETIRAEYQGQRRTAQLAEEDVTDDVQAAAEIAARLRDERDRALEARQRAEGEQAAAAGVVAETSDRLDALTETVRQLGTLPAPLLPAGRLTAVVDVSDGELAGDATSALGGAPEVLSQLLHDLSRYDQPAITLRSRMSHAFAQLSSNVIDLRRALDEVDHQADERLQAVEATLRDARDEVVAGDRLVQSLRSLTRGQLAADIAVHHRDASSRLVAVRHHVATFERRLDALADTTYATVQELMRAVRQTVQDSHLPTTPAVGRWAGLPLLKLGGMDTLTKEQRRSSILSTLQEWFEPDRLASRPSFDADETVWALVAAVTPRFTARVLIPSDPLDSEHKPVERLAVETSGGEGVTFALILASLLAARRAGTHGHRRTTLLLDNPFAKVTKPAFLRLARDVARSLRVQLVALTGIRDLGALTVFPGLIQLRVSRRETANVVTPDGIDDDRLQDLLRQGTLYVSPVERDAVAWGDASHDPTTWPVVSAAEVHWTEQMRFDEADAAIAEATRATQHDGKAGV